MPYSRNFNLLPSGSTASAAPANLADESLGAAIPGSGAVDEVHVLVQNTAGTGALTISLKLWGYNPELDRWLDLGMLNAGAPITPSKTDTVSWAQGVQGMSAYSRLYIEIVGALGGGASPAYKVDGVAIQKAR